MLKIFAVILILIFSSASQSQARQALDPILPKEPISACKFGEKKNLPENIFGVWEGKDGRIIFNRDGTTQSPGWRKETFPKIKYRIICNKDNVIHLLIGSLNTKRAELFYDYINIIPLKNEVEIWSGPIFKEKDFKDLSDQEIFNEFIHHNEPIKDFLHCDNLTCMKYNGYMVYGKINSK